MTQGAGKTKKTDSPTPGQPFCTNCKKNSHLVKDCWLSGGGKEGQGPRQKKRKDDDKKGKKHKGKKRANQAKRGSDDESEDDSRSVQSNRSYLADMLHSRYTWILDGGSTTHICRMRSAFTTFEPINDVVNGINKTGPSLEVQGKGSVAVQVSVSGQSD
jgi:hypothetical protein